MIVVIDNYDSFTYNLVQYLGMLGAEMVVLRNDETSIPDIESLQPERIMISPGPCSPNEAGLSCQVIEHFSGQVPVFGVCLGHQCIAQVFGGKVVRAERLMHGKTSEMHHGESGVFAGLPNPFIATRYHSLIVDRGSLPDELEITAWTDEDEIMGLKHKELPVHGVQFHPESVLTQGGMQMMENFLKL
ncbi:MAG: aminodeoxychorismate/anthranilate synthase component II [Verrucomicrobiota bacterium]|jgi:anthranilate synthase/aminodeoxychorismate synthase-like glutamine amidotransferase